MAQTGVVSWSQTAASNATADSNVNWAEGMAPAQVNDSARAEMASVAKWRDDNAGTLISSGTATAITLATNQSFSSLSVLSGQTLRIRFGTTSGSAPTLSVDGLAAKAITVDGVTAVTSGVLRTNSIHTLTYDNSLGTFIVHSGHSLIEPGRIMESALSAAPPGWLSCDGSAISRTTYADLFANISTTFGSSDSSTFKLPNRMGKVAVGVDSGSSVISNAASLGSTSGAETVTLTSTQMPSHTHTGTTGVESANHTHGFTASQTTVNFTAGAIPGGGPAGSGNTGNQSANHTHSFTSDATGGGGSHTNMPPFIAMNFYIKT